MTTLSEAAAAYSTSTANASRLSGSSAFSVTNGAIVIHTQRLKSDPGGNLLS
ncbi:methyl-accepting chemotaxis protein [Escherichia coli]|nr:methyl-accepting chemotaxis protein [Escherichia coli]